MVTASGPLTADVSVEVRFVRVIVRCTEVLYVVSSVARAYVQVNHLVWYSFSELRVVQSGMLEA